MVDDAGAPPTPDRAPYLTYLASPYLTYLALPYLTYLALPYHSLEFPTIPYLLTFSDLTCPHAPWWTAQVKAFRSTQLDDQNKVIKPVQFKSTIDRPKFIQCIGDYCLSKRMPRTASKPRLYTPRL